MLSSIKSPGSSSINVREIPESTLLVNHLIKAFEGASYARFLAKHISLCENAKKKIHAFFHEMWFASDANPTKETLLAFLSLNKNQMVFVKKFHALMVEFNSLYTIESPEMGFLRMLAEELFFTPALPQDSVKHAYNVPIWAAVIHTFINKLPIKDYLEQSHEHFRQLVRLFADLNADQAVTPHILNKFMTFYTHTQILPHSVKERLSAILSNQIASSMNEDDISAFKIALLDEDRELTKDEEVTLNALLADVFPQQKTNSTRVIILIMLLQTPHTLLTIAKPFFLQAIEDLGIDDNLDETKEIISTSPVLAEAIIGPLVVEEKSVATHSFDRFIYSEAEQKLASLLNRVIDHANYLDHSHRLKQAEIDLKEAFKLLGETRENLIPSFEEFFVFMEITQTLPELLKKRLRRILSATPPSLVSDTQKETMKINLLKDTPKEEFTKNELNLDRFLTYIFPNEKPKRNTIIALSILLTKKPEDIEKIRLLIVKLRDIIFHANDPSRQSNQTSLQKSPHTLCRESKRSLYLAKSPPVVKITKEQVQKAHEDLDAMTAEVAIMLIKFNQLTTVLKVIESLENEHLKTDILKTFALLQSADQTAFKNALRKIHTDGDDTTQSVLSTLLDALYGDSAQWDVAQLDNPDVLADIHIYPAKNCAFYEKKQRGTQQLLADIETVEAEIDTHPGWEKKINTLRSRLISLKDNEPKSAHRWSYWHTGSSQASQATAKKEEEKSASPPM